MSERKQNISVVAGRVTSLHRFDIFAALANKCNITVLSLDSNQSLQNYRTEFKHIIFSEKQDMPGYMSGLENHLSKQDLIIGHETFQLSSFQACRIAQKQQTPFWCLVDDHKPFRYLEYKNIRAIQSDIAQNITMALPSTSASARALDNEGLLKAQISVLPIGVDVPQLAEITRLRGKFRKYIGIPDTQIVITIEDSLNEGNYVGTLVRAFKLATEIRPDLLQSVSLLVVGDGQQQREIKCQTYDSGLARKVFFIHQDIAKISHDVFAASDIYVVPPGDPTQPYMAPVRTMAAGVWGAIPITTRDAFSSEVFLQHDNFVDDSTYQTMAVKIVDLCSNFAFLQDVREKSRLSLAHHHDANQIANDIVWPMIQGKPEATTSSGGLSRFENTFVKLSALSNDGRSDDAIRMTNLELESESLSHQHRSRLQAFLGQMLSERRQYDQALEAYTAALSLDEKNVLALSGLGMLSFHTQSYEEALKFFKRALAHNGDEVQSMFGLALVYAKLGLHSEAIYWFEKSMSQGSVRSAVLTLFIQSCMDSKNVEEALSALERVEEIVGSVEMTQMAIARLHVKLGNQEVGQEMMRKVLASS